MLIGSSRRSQGVYSLRSRGLDMELKGLSCIQRVDTVLKGLGRRIPVVLTCRGIPGMRV